MATADLSLATVVKSTDILAIGADGTNSNIAISFGLTQIAALSYDCLAPDGNRIRRFRLDALDGSATTIAGKAESGYADGDGNAAQFSGPLGVAVDRKGIVYVADTGNHRIRRITTATNSIVGARPELSVDLFPGVTITGVPGRSYRIESSRDAKNGPWIVETILQLPRSPYLWMDPVAVTNPRKFYRVVDTE
jgi:DNA-binding beta-propeller fold protein YncE